jgi:hypothetical protein
MSVTTKSYADAAEASLAQALAARRRGDLATALTAAVAARGLADLCRGAMLSTSWDDVNDEERARRAAGEAEDLIQPASGGARSTVRFYRPGEWRVPGQPAPAPPQRTEADAWRIMNSWPAPRTRAGGGRR